jgi:outer membrane lipoprotein SlyB
MADYRNSVGESELFGRISGGFVKVMESVNRGRYGWDANGTVVCESEGEGVPVEEADGGKVSISVIRHIFMDDHRGDCDRDEEFVEDREFDDPQEALDYAFEKYRVDKFDKWHGTAKSMINRFTMEQYEVIPHGFKFAEGEGGTLCVAVDEGVVGSAVGAGLGACVGGPVGAVAGGALGQAVTGESEDGEGIDEGVVGSAVGAGLGACIGGPVGAVAGGALGQAVTKESKVCEDGDQDSQPAGGQPEGGETGGGETDGGETDGQDAGGQAEGGAEGQDDGKTSGDAAASEAPQQVNGSVNECGRREKTGTYRKVDEGVVGSAVGAGLGACVGGPVGAVAGGALGQAVTGESESEDEGDGAYECDFPAWALNYVVNGERGSVSPEERRMIEDWKAQVREAGFRMGMASFGEDEHFCRRPAFGEPCQCVTVVIPAR